MKECSVEGCDKPVHSKGMCGMHAQRVARWGSPDGFAPTLTIAERLWQRVRKTEGCWEWEGSTTKAGYGQIFNGSPGQNSMTYTHRLAYELLVGPIPDGLEIDHLCRNKVCCNPAHLEPVTPAENRGRANRAPGRKPREWAGHSYGTGCRCDDCKAANTEKCRRYRQRLAVREHMEREAG